MNSKVYDRRRWKTHRFHGRCEKFLSHEHIKKPSETKWGPLPNPTAEISSPFRLILGFVLYPNVTSSFCNLPTSPSPYLFPSPPSSPAATSLLRRISDLSIPQSALPSPLSIYPNKTKKKSLKHFNF